MTYYNDTTTNLGIGEIFTGITRDMGGAGDGKPDRFRAIAIADQASAATNGFRIEMSNDAITWRAAVQSAVAINVPQVLEAPVVTRYYRVVYVNGASAQTAFMLNSSVMYNL